MSIHEFFQKKGAIELLCEIDPHGSRYMVLKESVFTISPKTVSKRVAEARDIGLLEVKYIGGYKNHVFTPNGASIRLLLDDMGVTGMYRHYKNAHNQFKDEKDKMKEWAKDPPSRLDDKEEVASALYKLQNRPLYSDDENEN